MTQQLLSELERVKDSNMEKPLFKLPEWNDLTNDQRSKICGLAEDLSEGDCVYFAGDCALQIYEFIRENVFTELPPLLAKFHDAPPEEPSSYKDKD